MTVSPHGRYDTAKTLEIAIDELIVARFPSAKELRDNAQAIADLLSDSIELFAVRTGIRTTRFEDAYPVAVEMTIGTLAKPHLRGICRFERLPVEAALRWVKSRLLSNLKTVLTNPKSNYWLGHLDREEVESFNFGHGEIETELSELSSDQVVGGLRTLFLEGADIGEIEYLADRFGIDPIEVTGRHELPVLFEKTLNGNVQVAFDFQEAA